MDSFYSLIEQHFGQIIGVIGTLLGVVLGYILNAISRYGRVKFYVNSVEHELIERDFYGGQTIAESITADTVDLVINIELDVINKSEHSRKILRDINFLVNDKSFKINKNILDNSTRRTLNYSTTKDNLKVINMQAKEVRTFNLT